MQPEVHAVCQQIETDTFFGSAPTHYSLNWYIASADTNYTYL